MDVRFGEAIVTLTPDFKPGDPEPTGYLDWHAWAEIQHKGGLRQTQCPKCGKWQFPQTLSTREMEWQTTSRRGGGVVTKRSAFICMKCVAAIALAEAGR